MSQNGIPRREDILIRSHSSLWTGRNRSDIRDSEQVRCESTQCSNIGMRGCFATATYGAPDQLRIYTARSSARCGVKSASAFD